MQRRTAGPGSQSTGRSKYSRASLQSGLRSGIRNVLCSRTYGMNLLHYEIIAGGYCIIYLLNKLGKYIFSTIVSPQSHKLFTSHCRKYTYFSTTKINITLLGIISYLKYRRRIFNETRNIHALLNHYHIEEWRRVCWTQQLSARHCTPRSVQRHSRQGVDSSAMMRPTRYIRP